MKIEYEIPDEEFPVFLAALNNEFLSLQSTYFAMTLGCDVPKVFEPMQKKYNYDQLSTLSEERLNSFLKFYRVVESLDTSDTI